MAQDLNNPPPTTPAKPPPTWHAPNGQDNSGMVGNVDKSAGYSPPEGWGGPYPKWITGPDGKQYMAQQPFSQPWNASMVDTQGADTSGPGHTQIGDWLSGAWDTFSGKNNYRAPEQVFNPMAAYQPGASLEDRTNQLRTANAMNAPNAYYSGLMTGASPSLAERQMNQGVGLANKQGMQAASGARGVNRAMAFRTAMDNAANNSANAAIAGGNLRAQEQQLGAQGYSQGIQAQSNMAGTTRQQDISEQQGVLGLQNQAQSNLNQQINTNAGITGTNAANQQRATGGIIQSVGALLASDIRAKENIKPADIEAAGPMQKGRLAQAFTAQGADPNYKATEYAGPDTADMAAAYRRELPGVTATAPIAASPIAQALMSTGAGMQGGSPGAYSAGGQMFSDSFYNNLAGKGGGGSGDSSGGDSGSSIPIIGSLLSDESSKENLAGVHPYQFDYKDADAHRMASEEAGKTYARVFADAKAPRVGVMAQDLARNPVARETVAQTPAGLAIEGKRAMGFMLANQADLNDRLNRIEKGKRA